MSNNNEENNKIIYGTASWYSSADACGPKTNNNPGCPTASGRSLYELEAKGLDFCASNEFGFGARLKITNASNGKSVICTVLDRGGFKRYGRRIDLGKQTFGKIEDPRKGIVKVKIEVLK